VAAAYTAATGKKPNVMGIVSDFFPPMLKHGPNTAFGGKGRERPWGAIRRYLVQASCMHNLQTAMNATNHARSFSQSLNLTWPAAIADTDGVAGPGSSTQVDFKTLRRERALL